MKFEFLKYFTVLAEELHFSRAAAKLSITQPPLSAAIKSLEAEVGVLLFQRTRTMVQLTPAGAAFLTEARKILDGYVRAKSAANDVGKGLVGRLDIGFGPTLIFRDILPIIDQFKREAPSIEIVLHEMPNAEQFELLLRGQLNAGFTHGAVTPPPLRFIPLKEDSFVLCLPAEHAKAEKQVIDLRELAGESFLMFARDVNPVNHDNVITIFSRAGIYPRFSHYTRGWLTMMSMVAAGFGLAILPSSLARSTMGGVRFIPFSGARVAAQAMLAWNPVTASPALEKFLACASQTIQAQLYAQTLPDS